MLGRLISFLLVATTLPMFAQDSHLTFRGAYLGEPLSDYVDCSSGKAKALKTGYKTYGKLCEGKPGVVVHSTGRKVLAALSEGEDFAFNNRVLTRIRIDVFTTDWDKIRYDLTEKLGEPLSESQQTYQNWFGAQWKFDRGVWRKADLVAAAGMKVSQTGNCGGFLGTLANGNQPCSEAIEIVITTAKEAGMPDTKPNTLD